MDDLRTLKYKVSWYQSDNEIVVLDSMVIQIFYDNKLDTFILDDPSPCMMTFVYEGPGYRYQGTRHTFIIKERFVYPEQIYLYPITHGVVEFHHILQELKK